jgi:amino acid transporter
MAGVFWRPFINNLYWNMNSFDVGASFAGELENSDRVFAKAMFLSVAFVMASYILPLLVAVGVSDTQREDWKAGHLTVVAGEIAGPWLASLIMLAAAVSNIALFMAELSGDAYQLMGMADRGLIPKVFCKRSRFDTPTNGILVGTLVIICLSVSDFDALVEMLNFAYSVSLLMEYVAFVKLRITDDDLERPYRIPFGTVGCILFLLPPCCICLFLIVVASKRTYVYVFILILFGICFQFLQKAGKHYHWWAYAEAPKYTRKGNMKAEMSNRV